MAKPIKLSKHAVEQCRRRHVSTSEVVDAIRDSPWEPAKGGRFRARKVAPFGKPSPVTGVFYQQRAVEAIFAHEADRIVVVTVLAKYWNERSEP